MNRLTAIRALCRGLGWLPLPVNHAVGASLGTLLWLIPNRQRATAIDNVKRCFPELTVREQRQLARRSLREMGKSVTELGVLWYASEARIDRLIRGMEGRHVWDRVREGRRPALIVAPHLGAFEALNQHASRTFRLRGLYRQPRQVELEGLLLERRQRFGAELIRADRRGLLRLIRESSTDDVIAVLPDQVPKRGQGVDAPFFGHPAPTMVLYAKLMQRLDPQPVSGFAERLPWGRGYRLHFHDIQSPVGHRDPVIAATALNQEVEACIRKAPEQYQWSYARFGRRAN